MRYPLTLQAQPPSGPLRINRANRLGRDLAFLMPLRGGGDMVELVTGRLATRNGALASTASSWGGAPLFGSGLSVDFPAPLSITDHTAPITFAWISEGRSTSAYSAILHWKPPGASQAFLIYRAASDSAYQFAAGPGGSSGVFTAATGLQGNGTPERFVLVCLGGMAATGSANYRLYRNGVQVAAGSNTTFGSSTSAVSRIGALGSGGDVFEGLIGHLHIWPRSLTDAEALDWTRQPWQTLDTGRRIWLPVQVAGGGFSAPAGRADEAAQALALAARLSAPAGLATEASAALDLPARLVQAVGLASESSSALAPSAALQSAAGLAVETDEALALSPAGAVQIPAGRSDSAESPLALSARLLSPVQLASETGTAFALSPSSVIQIPTGLAVELCAALAPSARLVRQAGVAHETGIALALLHAGAAVITTPARRRLTIAAHPRRLSLPAHRRRLDIPFHARRLVIPGDT